jgi:hypothetical protein
MNIDHFTNERIKQVQEGDPLTCDERDFLVGDTPHFEECSHTEEDLRGMTDKDLMNAAYYVWAEYASGQV